MKGSHNASPLLQALFTILLESKDVIMKELCNDKVSKIKLKHGFRHSSLDIDAFAALL